jgi:inner membrane protein
VVVLGILAVSFDNAWLAWFAVGYASHLLADSLTKGGIPMLGPLSKRRFGLLPRGLRISNGSRIEAVLSTAVWAGFLGLVILSILNMQFPIDLRPKRNTVFIPLIRKG